MRRCTEILRTRTDRHTCNRTFVTWRCRWMNNLFWKEKELKIETTRSVLFFFFLSPIFLLALFLFHYFFFCSSFLCLSYSALSLTLLIPSSSFLFSFFSFSFSYSFSSLPLFVLLILLLSYIFLLHLLLLHPHRCAALIELKQRETDSLLRDRGRLQVLYLHNRTLHFSYFSLSHPLWICSLAGCQFTSLSIFFQLFYEPFHLNNSICLYLLYF